MSMEWSDPRESIQKASQSNKPDSWGPWNRAGAQAMGKTCQLQVSSYRSATGTRRETRRNEEVSNRRDMKRDTFRGGHTCRLFQVLCGLLALERERTSSCSLGLSTSQVSCTRTRQKSSLTFSTNSSHLPTFLENSEYDLAFLWWLGLWSGGQAWKDINCFPFLYQATTLCTSRVVGLVGYHACIEWLQPLLILLPTPCYPLQLHCSATDLLLQICCGWEARKL